MNKQLRYCGSYAMSLLLKSLIILWLPAVAQYQPVLIAPMGAGGGYANGSIIEYNMITGDVTRKESLGQTNGSGRAPIGTFIKASNGKYYGVTQAVVTNAAISPGMLYEYDAQTGTYTELKSMFDYLNNNFGVTPYGGLVEAPNGKLYGTTMNGVPTSGSEDGVLFEYETGTNTLTQKSSFVSATTGSEPTGALANNGDGLLYGTNAAGGANGDGTLFQYNTSTGAVTKLDDFSSSTTGKSPQGNLVKAPNGKYYGTTSSGGANDDGVIYEFNTSNNTITKIADFEEATTGMSPIGGLFLASNGLFYAAVRDGGANGLGTLVEFNYSTGQLTKKQDFDVTNVGLSPLGLLMEASDGMLYGATMKKDLGALQSSSNSILFQYDIANNTLTPVKELDQVNAGQAWGLYNQFVEDRVPCSVTIDNTVNLLTGATTTLSSVEGGLDYQWIDCITGPINGATDQEFSPMVTGDYAVIITKSGCVDTSDCTSITITSFNDPKETQNTVQVIPNPNNGTFTVTIPNAYNGSGDYEIMNSLGTVMNNGRITAGQSKELKLNTKAGVYFIRFKDNSKPVRFEIY